MTTNSQLNQLLATVYNEANAWILPATTLLILSEYISREQPSIIVEFGSGISTLWLAYCLKRFGSSGPAAKIVSIEQDDNHIQQTKARLAQIGLADAVELVHCPKGEVSVCEERIISYQGLDEVFSEHLDHKTVDMVLIDGPSGRGKARFGTLPHLNRFLRDGARVFLDDALRPYELNVIEMWSGLGMLKPEGVILVEHGLFVGMYVKREL